jgi:pimeloyl-ACP methyl ester carboxylesterase
LPTDALSGIEGKTMIALKSAQRARARFDEAARRLLASAILLAAANAFAQPVEVEIKGDSPVSALVFGRGSGEHTVIALHGARQQKELFRAIAPGLARRGYKVISINWAAGREGPGPGLAPLAATIRYARDGGAKKISLMGFSRGAELAARFASAQPDGDFDTLILLSSVDDQGIPLAKTKKLFVFHEGDRLGRWSQVSADKSSEPKQVFALKGGAHGISDLLADKPDLIDEIANALGRPDSRK